MRNLFLKVAIIGFAIPNLFIPSSTAADYPPSVEVLVVGKPLAKPLPPKDPAKTVVVPKATSDKIPIIIGTPKWAVNVLLDDRKTTVLSDASVQSPVRLRANLIIGGIGADEKAPVATVSRSKNSEIQIPTDVPTRISVTGFRSGDRGSISIISKSGAVVLLGAALVNSGGRLVIPAFTFDKAGLSFVIRVIVNGRITDLTIRSTG